MNQDHGLLSLCLDVTCISTKSVAGVHTELVVIESSNMKFCITTTSVLGHHVMLCNKEHL